MMKRASFDNLFKGSTLLVFALAVFPLVFAGCSGCQKEAEQPAPAAEPAPAPAPAPEAAPEPAPAPEAKAEPAPAAGAVVPVTLDVLKLMPDSSMFTLGLPPLAGLLDKGVAFAGRIAPEGVDVKAEVDKAISQMAQDVGAPDAATLAEVAQAKGLNAEAPIAVFADFTRTAESLNAILDEVESAGSGGDIFQIMAKATPPEIVVVLGCSDPDKAKATLEELVGLSGYVDATKVEDVEAAGVTMHCYDAEKLAYFVAGDKLVVGSSMNMLKAAAARLNDPAPLRYGSTECPASVPDEIVILERMDKMMPLVEKIAMPLMSMAPMQSGVAELQTQAFQDMVKAYSGADPAVVTLALSDEKLELMTRLDLGKHPELVAYTGEAKPMRLATVLPEGTLAMLGIELNEQMKERITQTLSSLGESGPKGAPGLKEALPIVEQVLGLLSDEVTLGITGMGTGLPALFLMAGLTDVDVAKESISTYGALTDSETYNDVAISSVALPLPIPLYAAFPESTLVLSNDLEKLKVAIDSIKNKAVSNHFGSLTPPLDPAIPRYSVLSLNTDLVQGVVVPLSALAGGIPPEIQDPLNKVTAVVQELRAVSEVNGSWYESSVSLFLK